MPKIPDPRNLRPLADLSPTEFGERCHAEQVEDSAQSRRWNAEIVRAVVLLLVSQLEGVQTPIRPPGRRSSRHRSMKAR